MSDTLVARFLAGLPYELTTAQRRALAVIVADLAGPFPMHRLLQGDVGSGKTVVAVAALLAAVQSGHQGALMVPTEVLAEQHFTAVRALLGDLEGPGGIAGGERPRRAAHQQGEGRRPGPPCSTAWPRAPSTSWWAPTRC